MRANALVLAVYCCMATAAPPALAQEPASAPQTGGVSVELNKLEPVEGACRAYLVLNSQAQTDFESLKLDLVMFGPDSVVSERVAVEGAPLPAGKTTLRVFDVQGQGCEMIGSVLLNDILDCRDAGGPVAGCLDLVETSSRAAAEFIK